MPYPEDPRLRAEVLELYDTAWPAISGRIRLAGEWGSDWYAMSTPVVLRDGPRLVAHAGLAEVELLLAGRRCSVAAVHAVCVHPEFRGRGLGREVMELALRRIDATGHRTTILWSEKSAFYAKFGFAPVKEPVYVGEVPRRERCTARRLDLRTAADRQLLTARLATRRPVSNLAAAADRGWHFLIDLALWPAAESKLVHLPEEDAIAVADVQGTELYLYDLLADELPPLARVVGALAPEGKGPQRVVVYFTPDRLDVSLTPQPHRMEDWLHVRGEPLLPGEQAETAGFALSPFTRT